MSFKQHLLSGNYDLGQGHYRYKHSKIMLLRIKQGILIPPKSKSHRLPYKCAGMSTFNEAEKIP